MRVVEVGPERLARWVAGFGERHDGAETHDDAGRIVALTGGDGARAEMEWFSHDPIGVVLVRRGGYAVGLAVGGRFTESKVGKRHVQSRTAAGGWSQQRFARRRGNQADALVEAVTGHTVRILLGGNESPRAGSPVIPAALVLGGDRTLAADVLAAHSLRALVGLPRREFYDLPDPRRDVLERALDRGRSVRITLTEPLPRDGWPEMF
ncbi:acVLRF1 family peptidyl-tRNA hydrolase [Lapillicoccus sp.]|uniref:acVLRF1 family peptidyl-tRNA hydrolase n=1 Tax=Lapillicoccus sp. TaxID=1909287 RepID=UPI0032635F2A